MNEYWIVVVDDEPLSLTNAKALLKEQGMRVSCLRAGADLLKFMEKNTPDLILLDIMMPEMDGFETFRALRSFEEKEKRAQTPIIFLTGEKNSEIERRGLNAGASDFILKPFDKDVLINRIKKSIANSRMIESLTEEAMQDKLTGFLNKASGTEMVSGLCRNTEGALMILDLDSFKLVNDLYGHDMGDRVLIAFSDIIRHNVRADDVVSRIGGDEFMVFFRYAVSHDVVSVMTERLNEQLLLEAAGLMGGDFDIPLGISVGAVFVPEYGTDFKELFRMADKALYHVKQNGKHGYEVYDQNTENEPEEEDLALELKRAVRLVEERGAARGAMLLGRDDFATSYRFIIRFTKRYRGKATKLLFALRPAEPGMDISPAVVQFGELLRTSLRKSDIIMRNRSNQFFALLYDLSEEYEPNVVGRLENAWKKREHSSDVILEHTAEFLDYSAQPDEPVGN